MSLMDKLRDGVTKVTETGEKATRYGQLKLGIATLESKLADRYADLGHRCYELHLEEKVRVFDDEKAAALCKELTDMLAEMQSKKWELEKMQADDSNQ